MYVPAIQPGMSGYRRGMGADPITINPNAWGTWTSNDPATPPGFNTPVTLPPGTLNCPGDPGCPGYVDPNANLLAQQGVCTCVNNVCVENGNSCGSPAPAGSPAQRFPGTSAGIKEWVNANPTLALGLGAGLLVLVTMIFPARGRR